MLKSKGKIQVGIYLISILMMGVVGIASAISVIGANFPELSQTDVQTLISIPCIIIIPVTLIVGKLMQVMSKKLLAIIGIILFSSAACPRVHDLLPGAADPARRVRRRRRHPAGRQHRAGG